MFLVYFQDNKTDIIMIVMQVNSMKLHEGMWPFMECVQRVVGERFLARKEANLKGEEWEALIGVIGVKLMYLQHNKPLEYCLY